MAVLILFATSHTFDAVLGFSMISQDPNRIEWQALVFEGIMFSFLPLELIGLWKPAMGWKLLFGVAFATVIFLAVPSHERESDSVSSGMFLWLPMLISGALFLWRSRWRHEPLIGSVRTFGKWEPGYAVIGYAPPENGEERVLIQILHGGEQTTYKLKDAMKDPLKP